MTFTASIETDAGTYEHGFHLGTHEQVARDFCVELFHKRKPKQGTRVVTVGLKKAGKLVDTYYGDRWQSDVAEEVATDA